MKKINIVYVVTNLRQSGPINQTLYIIRNLNRNIFEPIVITLFSEDKTSYLKEYQKEGIKIIQLKMNKVFAILKGKEILLSILEKLNPDIIHAVGIPPYRLTLKYKKSIHFVTLRNYCFEDYPDKYGKLKGKILAYLDMALIKKQLKKGEPFVTCSSSLTEIYRVKVGLDIDYIRNGVDISRYVKKDITQTQKIRQTLSLPIDKIIFVYSGAIIDRKNQEEAIKGFLSSKHSRSAVLLLLGDGNKYEYLKTKYSKYKNILLYGKTTNVQNYLAASDIYISSSKSEGLPNGVLEAMAVGLPILLSDIPQHLEILQVNKSMGKAYQLGNIKNLANEIDSFLEENLEVMGMQAYTTVKENFTDVIMSEKYQLLYQELVLKQNNSN